MAGQHIDYYSEQQHHEGFVGCAALIDRLEEPPRSLGGGVRRARHGQACAPRSMVSPTQTNRRRCAAQLHSTRPVRLGRPSQASRLVGRSARGVPSKHTRPRVPRGTESTPRSVANAAVRVLRVNIALSQDQIVKLIAKSLSFPRAGGWVAKSPSQWSPSWSSTAARSARVARWSLRSVATLG